MKSERTFAFKDARVKGSASGFPLIVELGARWVWADCLVPRIGMNFGWLALRNRDVTTIVATSNSSQAESAVKDDRPLPSFAFDLGIGYAL